MSTPLIGISVPRSPENSAFGVRDSILQVMEYSEAIVAAGGRPVLLPATETIPDDLLAGIGALVLSGGGDLSPSLFGEELVSASYGISEIRDTFEQALVADAIERSIPILAICRGLQLINVIRGGTLHMDIPGHWQSVPADQTVHSVDLVDGSALAELTGSTSMEVNSYHHQGIKDLGRNLTPVAFAGELIEAYEATDADILAVQWHPEHLYEKSESNMLLFREIVRKASTK
ncbi:putative glutamine amidotransferase [Aurantimicrobium minutum]|uniref:gamma-glutamyl-gamma-aminobutyrate hydrolase family protein n=1 Tax=Aurantimicrobium minutum TaxID=708131 RepID=UPI002475C4FB|nr:gamma-glutamyl-gamma-aminobutyrate hydrolase family protein [Aurantimicrobium minutum]MDH6255106.1 putative glutamine amidotransferase [Aurantimicrobium minutum]MDH6409931.1 putative glutamine amidotransferase [Aurantimicrobium minutum]MDH6424126.1 putative glutamine amidotransferase [Aurantimicrobium minutum]